MRRKPVMRFPVVIAAASAAALLLAGCSSDSGSSDSPSSTSKAKTTTAAMPPLDMSQFDALPPCPDSGLGDRRLLVPERGGCSKNRQSAELHGCVSTEGTVNVALTTTAGPIGMELNRAEAPCTVNSIVSLTEQKYFDDTPCHRLVTTPGLQILQCGDPSGKGTGGTRLWLRTTSTRPLPTRLTIRHSPCLPSTPAARWQWPTRVNRAATAVSSSSSTRIRSCRPTTRSSERSTNAGLATIEKIAADGDDGGMGATGGGAPNTPDHHRDCSSRLTPCAPLLTARG